MEREIESDYYRILLKNNQSNILWKNNQSNITQKGDTKRLPSVNNTPKSITYRDALYLKTKVLDNRFTDEIKCP